MTTITMRDGTRIFYRDWGSGQPIVFSHGWPLCGDAFEDQMFFLARQGYRVIAHDRRGHGWSGQPWQGNDMDGYADDLADLVAATRSARRDLRRPFHRRRRSGPLHRASWDLAVAKAVLIGAVAARDGQGPEAIQTARRSRRSTRSAPASSRTARSSSWIFRRRSTATTARARRSPKACDGRSGCRA